MGRNKNVHTWYFKANATISNNSEDTKQTAGRHKGIFGYALAYGGVTEAQHRGALHAHFVVLGGITPDLLEHVAGYTDLCHEVSVALDSMYKGEISDSGHLFRLLCKSATTAGHPKLTKTVRKATNFPTSSCCPSFSRNCTCCMASTD